jgi:hypothetical protein
VGPPACSRTGLLLSGRLPVAKGRSIAVAAAIALAILRWFVRDCVEKHIDRGALEGSSRVEEQERAMLTLLGGAQWRSVEGAYDP